MVKVYINFKKLIKPQIKMGFAFFGSLHLSMIEKKNVNVF